MTRKDFIKIATILHQTKLQAESIDQCITWHEIVGHFADELQTDNPRFNDELFIYACNSGDVNARRVK